MSEGKKDDQGDKKSDYDIFNSTEDDEAYGPDFFAEYADEDDDVERKDEEALAEETLANVTADAVDKASERPGEDIVSELANWGRSVLDKSLGELRSSSEQPLEGILSALRGGVSELSSQAVKFATNKTLDTTARVLKSSPENLELLGRAGRSLKDLREVAGVSIEELSNAIDLNDVDLLRAVEDGKAALPFEVLLRMSSFYARNDPIPFVMKYSRVYSPRIWKLLHAVGIDTLVINSEREKKFVQIYRARDDVRKLSDESFLEVLEFTRKSFEMALHFVARQELKQMEVELAAKARDNDLAAKARDGDDTEKGDGTKKKAD